MYRGGFEAVGGTPGEPDYLYYNADIINNNDLDQANGVALPDPVIRFNETRDKALITNAADYHFSIVRFTMNGANLDLPLFIPQIPLDGSATYDPVNGTQSVYSFTMSIQQTWNVPTSAGDPTITQRTLTLLSPQQFVYWYPQYNNTIIAPPPLPNVPLYSQNLSSRFWWATDYSYVINLFNEVMNATWVGLYNQFVAQWPTIGGGSPPPYSNVQDFVNGVGAPPNLVYNQADRTIQLFADSDCFGQRLVAFADVGTSGTPSTPPYARLFMNANCYGLLSGFSTTYWNLGTIPSNYNINPLTDNYTYIFPDLTNVQGGTYEINFFNRYYSNVVDYRVAPYAGQSPLGFVPSPQNGGTINYQKVYYVVTQDYKCVDTLWSPIASITFESTLLPLVRETTGKPVILGASNTGNSATTTPSAFQPIITDIAIDQALTGADAYRGFIYYAPSAEYRLADTAGNQEIRNIDISVYWKARLTGEYVPVSMFNLSAVSCKVMFRKKGVAYPKEAR
jgi:hypothetical protein